LSDNTPSTPFTPGKQRPKDKKKFTFDRVWSQQTTQLEVFKSVEQYVEAAINGYNATVFCYG